MQLTNNQALVCYGAGGATAVAGYYNPAFLIFGMFMLFTISFVMTIFEAD